jgi:sugar phosphate isomerase/epimerase
MRQLVVDRTLSLFDWIEMAADLPINGLEIYDGFLLSHDASYLDKVRESLDRRHLEMPMFCVSPDFTWPTLKDRRREIEREKRMIDVTAHLGGRFCRVLSGQGRPEVTRQQGTRWVIECIRECVEYAAQKSIVLSMENHYKDDYWKYPEFAQRQEVFLEIVNALEAPNFGVQYDPSNALIAGENPIELLEKLKHRVVTMHASDRHLSPGHSLAELRELENSVGYARILVHGRIGAGLNDYPLIFRILKDAGFDGWVSIEDGMNGMEELQASAEFLRPLMGLS